MQDEVTQRCAQRRAEVDQVLDLLATSNDKIHLHYQEERNRILERYRIADQYETRCKLKQQELDVTDRRIKLMQEEVSLKTAEIVTLQQEEEQWQRKVHELETEPRVSGLAEDVGFGLSNMLATITSNESRLRALEDQLLATQIELDQKAQEIGQLQAQRSTLQAERAYERETVTRTISENNALISKLKTDLEELRLRNVQPELRLRELQDARQRIQDSVTALQNERAKLDQDLQMAADQRRRSEEDVKRRLRTLTQSGDVAEVRQKLDETMMLLKAAALNLHTDYQLIGQIRSEMKGFDPGQREEQFNKCYTATKHCVADIYGPEKLQLSQWALDQPELPTNVPTSKVEQLLAAIKHMVIAYDMLPLRSKTQMREAGAVIENSYYLYALVKQATARLRELEIDRSRTKVPTAAKRSPSISQPRPVSQPQPQATTKTRTEKEPEKDKVAPRIAGRVTTTRSASKVA